MATNNAFKLKVYAPTKVFFEGDVSMIELTTTEGDLGVYRNHIPLTAIVAPGVLKIHTDDEVKEATLLDGFIEITKDEVIILSERCEWPWEIDIERAKEAKIRAERRMSDGQSNLARAEIALKKALIRINLAEKK